MDDFILSDWSSLLPDYLTSSDKNRLIDALGQFKRGNVVIDYSNFYLNFEHPYFLQGDVVEEIRLPLWNEQEKLFTSSYSTALILSNTCDISNENKRANNQKQCLFAPIVKIEDFFSALREKGFSEENLTQFLQEIRQQKISNLFFLPYKNNPATGVVALLDKVFWFPTEELNSYFTPGENGNIDTGRLSIMNHFGYYLFILKVSYHLCRLPEEEDRTPKVN